MNSIKKIIHGLRAGITRNYFTGNISQLLLSTEQRAAEYLNRRTASWTPRQFKTALILFCVLMGGSSLFITGKAVLSANGPPKILKVQRLSMPEQLKSQKIDSTHKY